MSSYLTLRYIYGILVLRYLSSRYMGGVMEQKYYTSISILSGGLLAIMIFFNGILSNYTSPVFSSLIVHTVGLVVSLILWFLTNKENNWKLISEKAPFWSYLGGFSGAFVVLTANIAVNSKLGLAGSLSFFILGQTIASLIVDSLGLFELNKKKLNKYDYVRVGLILLGSLLIINSGGK